MEARKETTVARAKFSAFLKEQNEANFKRSMPARETSKMEALSNLSDDVDADIEGKNAVVIRRDAKAENEAEKNQKFGKDEIELNSTFRWVRKRISEAANSISISS